MRISLLKGLWKGSMIEEQRQLLPSQQLSYSDKVMQSSFEFKENLKIIFIADTMKMNPVRRYCDLPDVTLTKEEQIIADRISQGLLKEKNGYDSPYFLVSDVIYDDEENILYIEAKKTKFSILCGLNGKFPKDSPLMQQDLYGMGVLIPVVTNDGYTLLLQSSKYEKKNYATVKGFVQPEEVDSSLLDTVEKSASQELMEELLADSQSNQRLPIKNRLEVSCVSFRKPDDGRGFVEFYLPAVLEADHQQLMEVVRTNEAPDKDEHTGVVQLFNLDPSKRFCDYENWAEITPGGRDQYPLVVSQASRVFNKNSMEIRHSK
jgi:hypothetical protein